MKKLFLLGLLSFGLLLPFGVNAESTSIDSIEEGNNSSDAIVTVGEVEVPVYDVNIIWDSLTYNWKYNYETNEYEWSVQTIETCELAYTYKDWKENKGGNLYTDGTCDTVAAGDLTYGEFISDNYHYLSDYEFNNIRINDYSTGGRILPSIKWTSSENYDFVQGNFKYYDSYCELISEEDFEVLKETYGSIIYTDSKCDNEFEYNEETQYTSGLYANLSKVYSDLTTEEIDDNARHYFSGSLEGPNYAGGAYYELKLDLTNKETPTTTPTTGDTIGTITITIKAYE